MALQHYDVRDDLLPDRPWVQKYWAPTNAPVHGDASSREITRIIHKVVDVTDHVLLAQWLQEQDRLAIEQIASLDVMREQLGNVRLAIVSAQDALRSGPSGTCARAEVAVIREAFAAPDTRIYFDAGDLSPGGIFLTVHAETCVRRNQRDYFPRGDPLPVCPACGPRIRYRFQRQLVGGL